MTDSQPLAKYGKRVIGNQSVRWLPPFMMNLTSEAMEQNLPMISLSPMKSKW